MAITLPLEKMSVEEKIRMMEPLCDGIATPVWHEEILAQREQSVQAAEDRLEDWELVKKDLGKELPCPWDTRNRTALFKGLIETRRKSC